MVKYLYVNASATFSEMRAGHGVVRSHLDELWLSVGTQRERLGAVQSLKAPAHTHTIEKMR